MVEKQMSEVVLGGSFFQPSYAMVSADPPKTMLWYGVVGKSGKTWLYHPERSDVWVDGGKDSRGCGGREIQFSLATGGTVTLIGPWHSNSDAFFADCGIDVRGNHVTWGCIGTERIYDENTSRPGIGNLIWFDPEPVKGNFDRVDMLAWEMQQQNPDRKLFVYWESKGGSSLGPVSEPYRVRLARRERLAVVVHQDLIGGDMSLY